MLIHIPNPTLVEIVTTPTPDNIVQHERRLNPTAPVFHRNNTNISVSKII